MAATLVFDIETIPDVQGIRSLHGLPEELSGEEVAEYAFQLRRASGGSDFLPHHLQRVVINDYFMHFVVQKIISFVSGRPNACVAILGLSFKANVDDFRLAHAFTIMDLLIADHITSFKVYDPKLNKNEYARLPEKYLPYIQEATASLSPKILTNVNVIVLLNPHQRLINSNDSVKLAKLLANTQQPCYVFDPYQLWTEAAEIKHIQYASLESDMV